MKNISKIILLFIFVLSVFFPIGAKAQDIEPIFDSVCKGSVVTKELAMAIARHESKLEPLAINIVGKSFFPTSIAEAKSLIEQAQTKRLSYDVGLMQINSYWIKRWGMNAEDLLDPEVNIKTGVKILSIAIEQYGFSWNAVGAYHSPKAERAERYAWNIYHMAKNTTVNQSMQQIKVGEKYIGKEKKGYSGLLLRRGSTNYNATGNTRRIIHF